MKRSHVLKAPDRCVQLFDRERFLITDKQTEILGCILCVMVIFLSTWQAEPTPRHAYSVKCRQTNKQTNKQTDKWTDGRTLPNVLSPFASRSIIILVTYVATSYDVITIHDN